MITNEVKNLVECAKNRDNSAMEQLYKEYYTDVYYVCKKYSLNDSDAEDITQDTFIQAFSKLSTLDNGEKFKSWVTTIAANKCLDLLKHNNVLQIDSICNENDEIIDIVDESKQTEEVVVEKEVKDILVSMMEKLPVEQRITLFMYYYQDYSIKEIANAYGCSEGTVKSRLNYAKKSMREEAEKLENKGIKLRVVAILPFLYTIYQNERMAFACEIPDSTQVLSNVMGSFVAASDGATNMGSAATYIGNEVTNATVANTGSAVNMINTSGGIGTVSKAGIFKGLGMKIALGVLGGAAVVGAVVAAITMGSGDKSEGESQKPSGIVSESVESGSEDVTSEADMETTKPENVEPDKSLVEFLESYKAYVNEQIACELNGGLSLYCNNKAKGTVEQIIAENCNRYNLFSTGTLTIDNTGYEMEDQYNKFVVNGTDGQLYRYEKKARDYVDGKGNPISSLSYNKYTRTPVEKLNLAQVWIDFIERVMTNPTVREVGPREEEKTYYNLSFTVTLSGAELVDVLDYTSVIEHINYFLQYSTDKRFVDYTYDVKVVMTINDFYNNEIIVTSDELVKDLIKSYEIKNGISVSGDSGNYTYSDSEDHYWQQIRIKYEFFKYEKEAKFYYPCYMDVEAAGNNILVDIYDQKEPYYVMLPKEIPGYEFYATDLFNTKFKETETEDDIEKHLVIDDRIGLSGHYGMDMANGAYRYVTLYDTSSSKFVVNTTTINGYKVYYIIDHGFLSETERTDKALFLYAQVELEVSEANGGTGYVCIAIDYVGTDSIPESDGMLETLTHIVEGIEYVPMERNVATIK